MTDYDNAPASLSTCALVSGQNRLIGLVITQAPQKETSPGLTARSWTSRIPYASAFLIAVLLMIYALVRAFVWDEGFHLVAAQLVIAGKRLYIDFCFPQTPLNTYWNAAWMRLFGQSWRVTHVPATLLTISCYVMVAHYLLSRFPIPRWRAACAGVGMLLVALNTNVVEFGTIAQAYAMSIAAVFAAFRFSIVSIDSEKPWLSAAAGLFSGVAAGASLLCAPVGLTLLLWGFFKNRAAGKWTKAAAFIAGFLVPFAPVFWLFVQAPYQVFFNVVTYQALFRRVNWEGATPHDVDVLSSWVDSGQTLLLALLAVAGLIYIVKQSKWDRRLRSEFYLCAWISLALIAYISTAHPTFSRYYVVAVPFLAVLGAPGLYAVGSRLISPERPFWPTAIVAVIMIVGVGRALFLDRDSATWQRYQEVAKKVAEVTPHSAKLYADEPVYFLLHWMPPPGMEFSYSHKLRLSPAEEAKLHIISEPELEKQVKTGVWATFQTCKDDPIDDWDLDKVYKQRVDISDCSVFWDYNPNAHVPMSKPKQ